MRIDLHNHTTRCHHAAGSMQAYVEAAIASKIKLFGFADHAPMDFDPKYRMSFDEMRDYENEISSLQEQYQDRLTILRAYEVDYLVGHMDDRVLNAKVDYLIGSVHFIHEWGFDNPEFIGRYEHSDIDQIWSDYFEAIEAMAKSGLFDIVGHLDLIKVFNFMPKKDIRLIADKALKAIKKANMTIEINGAGFRKPVKEAYPSPTLLEMAFELDIPITFASDAHDPSQVGLFHNEIEALARSVGYTQANYYRNRDAIAVNF